MIRLSANLSRKIPVPGIEFSSQQYGASMEIEVSDADKPEAIQARIRELYDLLSRSIDEQIAGPRMLQQDVPPAPVEEHPVPSRTSAVRGTRTARKPVQATAAQVRAIRAICQNLGVAEDAVCAANRVKHLEELLLPDASRVIDDLKARQKAAQTARR